MKDAILNLFEIMGPWGFSVLVAGLVIVCFLGVIGIFSNPNVKKTVKD